MSFSPKVNFTGSNTGAAGNGVCTAANTNYVALSTVDSFRTHLSITNTHASATIYFNPTGLAFSGVLVGVPVAPGGTYTYTVKVPTGVVNVASATAGASYFVVTG